MEIDTSNMRKVILDSPGQLEAGLKLAEHVKLAGKFSNIIICGMGGSALPAEILVDLKALEIPLIIWRDYGLPKEANEKSLIICISYSGKTEETVSSLEAAIAQKFTVVTMATGGIVEELAQKNNLPFVALPTGIQPRCATGYMFTALVKVLENAGLVENMSSKIIELAESLEAKNVKLESAGKTLAEKLAGKIPVVYAANRLKSIAQIWKIKFNENSKIAAFWNVFPELNHNEMVGYTSQHFTSHLFVVTLRGKQDHPRVLKRMELTAQVVKSRGAGHEFVDLPEGKSFLETIFSSLLLGDWVSYYLALGQGIDPTPVEIVETFKKDLVK